MFEHSTERAISNDFETCLILSTRMELANQRCMDAVFRLLGLHPRVLGAQGFKLLLS